MSPAGARSPVVIRQPRSDARVRLFCFPYAGAGAAMYRDWPVALPEDIEVAAVQLPGREWRIEEPLVTGLNELAADALHSIRPHLDRPFALLGASMGGTLVFELARQLRRAGGSQPCCLLPLAVGAPQIPDTDWLHDLPESELISRLRAFGVMSDEFLAHPELVELTLPILRADCKAQETYAFRPEPPLDCAVWVYAGRQDANVDLTRLEAWHKLTTAASAVHRLDGGHLFMDGCPPALMQSIARRIHQSLPD